MRRGFTLIEVLVAAGIIILIGTYVGRLAMGSREAVDQGQNQTQAAQILARLGGEAQRGNPQVVPAGTSRELDAATLAGFLGRDASGHRAEIRAADDASGLRDYAIRVCWADGCVEGSVRGPPPIAGAADRPPARVELGRGTLEILVEGSSTATPDVHVTNGAISHRVQRWGLTRLEGLPGGSYSINALKIRGDRYTYEAPPVMGASLGAGAGARAVVRYQPTTGAISISVSAPEGVEVGANLMGPAGNHTVRNSQLIPFLQPGNYTFAAPSLRCGDYLCEPRIEGSPATLAAGQTHSITLAYAYASGNLRVNLTGLSVGAVEVRGPAGYERILSGSTTLRDLAPGNYTLVAREVRQGGYTYRAENASIEVVAGQTAEVTIAYLPVTGRLQVRTNTEQDGVLGRVLRGTESLHSFGAAGGEWELAPGRFGVQPLAYMRDGFRYEAAMLGVDVIAGQTVAVTVSFAPVTAILEYSVMNLPRGMLADASLRGPGGYQQSLPTSRRLTGLAPGAYRFEAGAVEAGGFTYAPTPRERTLNLAAGQRYTLSLTYLRQEGGVRLAVSGQPSDAALNIRLRRGESSFPLNPGVNPGLPTGPFTLEAAPIATGGFTYLPELSTSSFSLAHGETKDLEVRYVRQSGTLNLVLEGLDRASMRLAGPMNKVMETAGSYGLLPGSYTLTAYPVERGGYRYTPSVEGGSFSLGVGETRTVRVRYLASTARLEVVVSGVGGPTPITLSGPSSRTLEGSATLEYLAPGSYTLTPSNVTREEETPYGAGRFTYRAPAQAVTLRAGETSRINVVYQRQQGSLAVSISGLPAGAAPVVQLEGPGFSHRFAGGMLYNLPTGSYVLTPEAVRAGGYTYRASPFSFVLADGEVQNVEVVYTPTSGGLRVNLAGPEGMPVPSARIWRDNQQVATLTGGGVLEDLLPGLYRVEPVTVRDAAGFDYTAPEQTVTVVAGQTATVSLTYVKQSGFVNLVVEGAPPVAYSLRLSGPRTYSLTQPGRYELASGSYTITAANLNYGGFLYRATVVPSSLTLAPGQSVDLTLTYTRVAGAFRFSVSGLPGGSRAPVSLSGPSSYSTVLGNGTTTTPDLLPGNYTLSTPDVALGGFTYRASGNAGSYSLGEGVTVPVSLSYAPITGRVQVNVSGVPSGVSASLRIVQAGLLHSFGSTSSFELAPGSYTLQADNLSYGGYTFAPTGQGSFSVVAGQTTTLNISYNAITGRLRVITSGLPFAPNYEVAGPQGLSITQADQIFDNLPPGIYTASPRTRDQYIGGGVVYRYRAGGNLVGQGEIWGATQTGPDSYVSGQRTAHPGGWVPVAGGTPVGVHACIENRSAHPAQVGFAETVAGGADNYLATGWQRGLWIGPGQSGCVSSVIQTTSRANLRIRPFLNIDGPWSGVGGTATFTQVQVAPLGFTAQASVTPGQTSILYVHYLATSSVVLNINRTSRHAPVNVVFNGQTFTAPGRHVINYLWPGSYPLQRNTTHYRGIAFIPSGPDSVLVQRGAQTVEVTVTYVPENRAALNLTVFRHPGHDSRFINSMPPALMVLRNGNNHFAAGVGSHSIELLPPNTYTLNRNVGYKHNFARHCGWWGCTESLYWRLESVTGLPLVPQAGEVYSAQAAWRGVRCAREWWWWRCTDQ